MEIIRDNAKSAFACDSVVRFHNKRENRKIKLLQITDIQIIDSHQMRTPDRLRKDEIIAWSPDRIQENFGNHLKSLIAQSNPDIIFITGDMVYGSFDDSGKVFEWFCDFMDSFCIPWAPVFGNHDNESVKGAQWQCDLLENAKYCLFKRGKVSGNGNYTVGICFEDDMLLAMYMLDSHGCLSETGIYPDQLEMVKRNSKVINEKQQRQVPALVAFHHPTDEYRDAEIAKGYVTEERTSYVIGVDVEAKDNDFGSKQQNFKKMSTVCVPGFLDVVKECNVQAVFAGHFHSVNTCITYENVKWVLGLKTGQYDYHTPGQMGGTLVTLENDKLYVSHLPSLVNYSPFPSGSRIFNDFFAKER